MSLRKFFIRKPDGVTPTKATFEKERFRPFVLKQNMKLAPTTRSRPLTKAEIENFDEKCVGGFSEKDHAAERLYLDELKEGMHRPRSSKRTVFAEPDVVLLTTSANGSNNDSSSQLQKWRRKLLQFHNNRRPSKCGYWMRTSKKIGGRRPFGKDVSIFDYDVDSDDEWEEEADGDDCKSDDEDEVSENDKEADDDDKAFFVDHGYLSTSENASDEEDADPESRRERGKAKMLTFEAEMESRKKKHLRLIAMGPYLSSGQKDGTVDGYWTQKMADFKTIILTTKPIPTSFTPDIQKWTPQRLSAKTPKSEKKKSLKRKTQDKGGKDPKRGALSLP